MARAGEGPADAAAGAPRFGRWARPRLLRALWQHGAPAEERGRVQGLALAVRPQPWSQPGKAARSLSMAPRRSWGTHDGHAPDACEGPEKVPWKNSHSFSANLSGKMDRAVHMPNASRSALKSDRAT